MRRKLNVVTALLVALLCINSVTGSDLSVFADVFATTVQTEEQTYEDTAPSETAADFEETPVSD